MARPGPWLPLTTVGRYQLLTPLAAGGMAEIWLARQPGVRGFEKLVVIKRMVGALEEDPEHVEMFLAEARLAAKLTHPHIVQIYELGEEAGSFFIVMEFVDGESLSTIFKTVRKRGERLDDALACRLMAWAAEGLHYAHTRRDDDGQLQCIVHRDVSPQNLLVTMDGSLKVVDFGIAKVASHATSSGKLKGKLAYMAPEQGRAEAVDARTDVFALGVCLFELLTGSRLFPGSDELQILRELTTLEQFPRVIERRPDVPPQLDVIVARAMESDPARRFESARELQLALEDYLVSNSRRVTAGDVAEFMHGLFADRIATRKALIDQARRGELTPSQLPGDGFGLAPGGDPGSGSNPSSGKGVEARAQSTGSFRKHLAGDLGPSVDVSMTFDPTRTNTVSGVSSPPARSKAPLALAALIATLLVGGGVWVATRPDAATTVAAEPDAGPAMGTLSLEVMPTDATLRVDGVAGPPGVTHLPPGEHTVEVEANGYLPQRRTLQLGASERQSLFIALERVPVPEALVVPVIDAGVAKPQRPTVGGPAKRGTLRLDTVPWTTVFLGGKRLGDTPILGASLPPGRHQLKLVNAEQGIDQTVEIEIASNETTVKKLRLK
ncbi:MAG: serine/threonine protein kinase [Myxococcaceae bacterium]|nr:serine/threonine protein kinase [Myxococcaceae bacterium]